MKEVLNFLSFLFIAFSYILLASTKGRAKKVAGASLTLLCLLHHGLSI